MPRKKTGQYVPGIFLYFTIDIKVLGDKNETQVRDVSASKSSPLSDLSTLHQVGFLTNASFLLFCFFYDKQLFSSQADGSPLSVDQQLRGREKPKILHPIPHVGGKYKDQKIILLVPLIIIIYFCSYVGILSGYAISLVAWSWYTDCADCPKVP